MELDKIINENCLSGLKSIPDNSIDCCVTSPPYFGLRDYGTAKKAQISGIIVVESKGKPQTTNQKPNYP